MRKIILMMFVMILLVGTVSAFDFDNIKGDLVIDETTSQYGKIEIRNSILGIPWLQLDKVAEIELKENTDSCLINCYASGTVTLYDGGELIDDLRFKKFGSVAYYGEIIQSKLYINKSNNKIKVDDYSEYCLEFPITNNATSIGQTRQECYRNKTGSHDETEITWEEYDGTKLPAGTYEWMITGKKKIREDVDWLASWEGIEITDWALWNSTGGLQMYLDMDEGVGTVAEDSSVNENDGVLQGGGAWITGKNSFGTNYSQPSSQWINVSNFTTMFDTVNTSFSFWFRPNFTETFIGAHYFFDSEGVPRYGLFHSTGKMGVLSGGTTTMSDIPVAWWDTSKFNHIVITMVSGASDNISFWANGNLIQSNTTDWTPGSTKSLHIGSRNIVANFFQGQIDEFVIWNRTLSTGEILGLWNGGAGLFFGQGSNLSVTLNHPVNNKANNTKDNIVFNTTVSSTVNIIHNISLFTNSTGVWHRNLTNNTIAMASTNINTIFLVNLTFGDYIWNVEVCDFEQCVFGLFNRSLSIQNFLINSETFENTTTEGNTDNFRLNISISNDLLSQASLIYNGTLNPALFIKVGNNYDVFTDHIAPDVDSAINLSFFWNLILASGSEINTTLRNQTVLNISLDDCSSFTERVYNITNVDEEEQTLLANSTIEVSVNVFNLDRTNLIFNFSNLFQNVTPVQICLNNPLNNSRYSVDTIIRYSFEDHEVGDFGDHVPEHYNIVNFTLSNATMDQNITLFDLLTADSTDFQVTFTGEDFLAVEDALIFVNRQYISENVFKTVELPKTDSNGQTVIHLVRNDIIYNFVVTLNGTVLGTFNNIVAFCEDFTIGECKIDLNAFSTGDEVYDSDTALGITFSGPDYENTTRIITFDYLTTDGTAKNVTMRVTRNDIFGNNSVCSASLISSSGSLNCVVPTHIQDSTVITTISVSDVEVVKDYVILTSSNFGTSGYFIFFFFMLFFILAFSSSKEVMLVGIVLGFITGIIFGLIEGRVAGIGASGVWLIVSVILMIWKLNKDRPD